MFAMGLPRLDELKKLIAPSLAALTLASCASPKTPEQTLEGIIGGPLIRHMESGNTESSRKPVEKDPDTFDLSKNRMAAAK